MISLFGCPPAMDARGRRPVCPPLCTPLPEIRGCRQPVGWFASSPPFAFCVFCSKEMSIFFLYFSDGAFRGSFLLALDDKHV